MAAPCRPARLETCAHAWAAAAAAAPTTFSPQGAAAAELTAAEPVAPDAEATPASTARRSAIRVERRRWARESLPTPDDPPAVVPPPVPTPVTPAPARPRTGRRRTWRSLVRLVALLVVVAMLVGATAYASGRLLPPGTLSATVVEATGATATRIGTPIPLTAGTALQVGDTVTVASRGSAVLGLGDSQVRLAGGSAVHLDRVDAAGVTVAQLAGRAYYRVTTDAHAPFAVTTGPVTWTATGTAFDTDREPVATGQGSGQERVTLLAIQDAVAASGPGFDTSVPQGERAVVYIGAATPTVAPALDAIPASALADPWLQANGAADLATGLPLGVLDGHLQVALASPTASASPSPFVTPSILPTDTPFPTALDTPSPTPDDWARRPARRRGPRPPRPPRRRRVSARWTLAAASCPAGVVLDWSTYSGTGVFKRYVTLRSPSGPPPVTYPAHGLHRAGRPGHQQAVIGPATTRREPEATSTYRTLALDKDGKVLAASAARYAGAGGGAASISDFTAVKDGQRTDFAWTPFSGPSGCFTEYRFTRRLMELHPAAPRPRPAVPTDLAVTCGAQLFVMEAIRVTSLGELIVAESPPTTCT